MAENQETARPHHLITFIHQLKISAIDPPEQSIETRATPLRAADALVNKDVNKLPVLPPATIATISRRQIRCIQHVTLASAAPHRMTRRQAEAAS
jgi:hypothetical protein